MGKCICCGIEEADRWQKEIFTGKGKVYLCWDCYINGRNKNDEREYDKAVARNRRKANKHEKRL